MKWEEISSEERLVAEQAVATLRALKEAAAQAPMGQGMNALEAVIHRQGQDHLLAMLGLAAASRPEAQKRGSAASLAGAENNGNSRP